MIFYRFRNLKSYFLIVMYRSNQWAGCPKDEFLIANILCLFHQSID